MKTSFKYINCSKCKKSFQIHIPSYYGEDLDKILCYDCHVNGDFKDENKKEKSK